MTQHKYKKLIDQWTADTSLEIEGSYEGKAWEFADIITIIYGSDHWEFRIKPSAEEGHVAFLNDVGEWGLTRKKVLKLAEQAGAIIGVRHHTNCDGDSIIFCPEELLEFVSTIQRIAIANVQIEAARKLNCDSRAFDIICAEMEDTW